MTNPRNRFSSLTFLFQNLLIQIFLAGSDNFLSVLRMVIADVGFLKPRYITYMAQGPAAVCFIAASVLYFQKVDRRK